MIYAKSFFDLQLQFARKVAVLSGLPFARAVLEYTNLYVRFGLGRDFDAAHPIWREYLAGLQGTTDDREWTYRFYSARSEAMAAPPTVATFGCFAYARLSSDRIRLHFQNAETDGHSPLGIDRRAHRLADLDRPLRACQTSRTPASTRGRGFVALQSRGLSSSVPGSVPCDRSRDRPAISAHAPVGAIPGPGWSNQREHDPSVPGTSRAPVESRPPGPVLPFSSALS